MKNFIAKYPIMSAIIFVAIIVAIIVYFYNNSASKPRVGGRCTSPYGGGQGTINADGICVPNDATQRNSWAYAMCRQACFNRNYKNPVDLQNCLANCDTFKNKTIIVPSTPVNPETGGGVGPGRPNSGGVGNTGYTGGFAPRPR